MIHQKLIILLISVIAMPYISTHLTEISDVKKTQQQRDSTMLYDEQSSQSAEISSQEQNNRDGQSLEKGNLLTPGSPMESLRRRHVTNQSYRQSPDNQLG